MPARKKVDGKKEERREPRVPYRSTLKGFNLLQPGANLPENSFEGKIIDLSETGIGLSISEKKEPKSPLHGLPFFEEGALVRLRVPITESNVTMPVLGQIIWRKHSKKKKEIRAGIRFVI